MIHVNRAVVLSLLCLLAFATSASAECAWVLGRQTIRPVQMWEIVQAHPTVKECSSDLVQFANFLTERGESVPFSAPIPSDTRQVTIGKAGTEGYLRCLPDTVDPRGPKGAR